MLSVETYPALPSPVTVDGNHSLIPFTLLKSCAELIYPALPSPTTVEPIPDVLTNFTFASPTTVEVSSVGSINELI